MRQGIAEFAQVQIGLLGRGALVALTLVALTVDLIVPFFFDLLPIIMIERIKPGDGCLHQPREQGFKAENSRAQIIPVFQKMQG